MRTKHVFLAALTIALLQSGTILAQSPAANPQSQPTPEQRLDMQVRHMEKRLLLDEATAAKFAPLYKEYLQAMKECRPCLRDCPKEKMTDEQLDQRMQARFSAQKKAIETKETYYKQFKKILNIRQVEQIFAHRHHPQMPSKPAYTGSPCSPHHHGKAPMHRHCR